MYFYEDAANRIASTSNFGKWASHFPAIGNVHIVIQYWKLLTIFILIAPLITANKIAIAANLACMPVASQLLTIFMLSYNIDSSWQYSLSMYLSSPSNKTQNLPCLGYKNNNLYALFLEIVKSAFLP